jgi:hypothetical protein
MSESKARCILCGQRTSLQNLVSVTEEITIMAGITVFLDGLVCKWEFASDYTYREEDLREWVGGLRLWFELFFRAPADLWRSWGGGTE